MKYGKLILNIVLTIAIVGLGYVLYDQLFSPYYFENAKARNYRAVKDSMNEIIKAQNAYRSARGLYAGNWDSLEFVLKNDSIPLIRTFGEEGDSVKVIGVAEAKKLFTISEEFQGEALLERIRRHVDLYNKQIKETGGGSIITLKVADTSRVPVLSTVDLKLSPDSLRYIPASNGDLYELSADHIRVGLGNVIVPTFEVVAYNRSILKFEDDRFYNPRGGIRLGSLTEAITDIREF